MKRNNKSNSEAIDCIELSNEATKFESDFQYLIEKLQLWIIVNKLL